MPSPYEELNREFEANKLQSSFMARLQLSRMDLEELTHRMRSQIAETLLMAGVALIPSDHLLDNQFCVSRGVYDAALKITEGKR